MQFDTPAPGTVTPEGAQGPVTLDETAHARLAVVAGDISVGRPGGSAEISTQKGDIRVGEALRGTATLRREYGDVEVGAARGVSSSLDAGTGHGRVRDTLRNADGAAVGPALRATTAHGDITARSL